MEYTEKVGRVAHTKAPSAAASADAARSTTAASAMRPLMLPAAPLSLYRPCAFQHSPPTPSSLSRHALLHFQPCHAQVEVLEYYDAYAVSGQGVHQLPAVVRIAYFVDIASTAAKVALNRRNVLTRDKYT